MKFTPKLKAWVVENCEGVSKDADDDAIKQAAAKAWVSGKLTDEKYKELTEDEAAGEANEFSRRLDEMGKAIKDLSVALTKPAEGKEKEEEKSGGKETEKPEPKGEEKSEGKNAKPDGGKSDPPAWHKSMKRMMNSDPPVDDVTGQIRVKGAWEKYRTDNRTGAVFPSATKSGKPHPFASRPVMDFSEKSRQINEPSDLDKAVAGAYAKLLCATAQRGGSRTFGFQSLLQEDKELIFHALEKFEWGGSTDGDDYADIKGRRLNSREQKALIDDASSGGLEAAPIVFDDQVIQTPLLHGELFPLVNQIPLDRGRRIEGVSTGTVTASWGGIDDSAVALFATASYVSAFDTTIYRWEGAIRIGLDFLSDTPIDFGQHVTEQYGERLLEDLDDVIATGNGTTQPEGVMNKSGTTSVAWGGTTSIGNYESLRFGVAKPEHRQNLMNSIVFCGTETSYQRARALNVGTADARRLFGSGTIGGTVGYDDYSIMGRPYKINESLANTQIFYAVLARYRMYRRRGLTLRTSTEGDTLIRNNEMLMVAMARYGGQLERGATAAVTTTAPA